MKMTPAHYEHLKTAMQSLKDHIPARRLQLACAPQVRDREMRLRWDLMYATVPSSWVCDNLYPYLDDRHIDTALKKIMDELK